MVALPVANTNLLGQVCIKCKEGPPRAPEIDIHLAQQDKMGKDPMESLD